MSAPKLCKDCKHLLPGERCAKSPMPPDYVYGIPHKGFYLSQSERETIRGCAPEGRWWEAK